MVVGKKVGRNFLEDLAGVIHAASRLREMKEDEEGMARKVLEECLPTTEELVEKVFSYHGFQKNYRIVECVGEDIVYVPVTKNGRKVYIVVMPDGWETEEEENLIKAIDETIEVIRKGGSEPIGELEEGDSMGKKKDEKFSLGERERQRLVEADIAEILAKYGVRNAEELEEKIRKGEVEEHPAWEDLIALERLLEEKMKLGKGQEGI